MQPLIISSNTIEKESEAAEKKNMEAALDQEVMIATTTVNAGAGQAATASVADTPPSMLLNNPPPVTPQGAHIEDNDSIIAVKDGGRVYSNQVSKQSNGAASGYSKQ